VKLSNKARYAVRALFDIAFFNGGQPTQVKDIADRQHIPARFLEQIFQDLKRAGIVGSKRGPQGGYTLQRSAGEIRLGDVIRALEGPLSLGEVEAEGAAAGASGASVRVTDEVFRDLSKVLESCFDEVSIQDICDRAARAGLRVEPARAYAYVI
jgi:Rrf2 family iron-sulfur cluster assembly transcriptional regulator